ncbi:MULTISPECIES: hypothetical protein [unclassified Sphingobacterium]|uniref:hypothetical protein n=1 Tax=unclassified Sphingobacterium TaxID=2609468 RepID=UPI00104647A6|nr:MULTISPECIES: hypothetical protein [unclassified Sphingobacterium]MCS3557487.1 hypothetical protein [Sphingobacterium sp. JUb21]
MDKLFFVIFNSYYKDNEFKNDNPPLTVGGLFTAMFFGIYMFFCYSYIIYQDVNARQGPTDTLAYLMVILSLATTYFIFFWNKRYLTIYEKYKDDIALRNKTTKFFCFFLVFFLIFSCLFLIAIRNKLVFGKWI